MRSTILAVLSLVLAACKEPPPPVAAVYDSAPVEVRDIEVTVEAAGVVEPESTVEVKSKASGEVLAVHGETGQVVEAGHLLVEIDKRTPRNRLAEAEAALLAAQARRKIAQTQMERAATLFASKTLTQADYEQTQLEFANAEAQVVSSMVAVENARITLEDTDVRAPITGTIIEKAVEPGIVITSPTQAVSGGTVLMKMADLTSVQVRTRVDETDIGKIQPGMPARVTVAAYPNQPFDGEVLKIEPQAIVDQNVTMFAVLIKIPNRGGLLKPGMNAEVQIRIASREAVTAVPTAALRAISDLPLTAAMLGMDEGVLRRQLWPDGSSAGGSARRLSLNGREIDLPEGVDPEQVRAIMAKRRSGQELTAEERALAGTVFRGGAGLGNGAGRGPGNRANGGSPTQYLFGGDYWVVALRGDQPVPVAVKTGLTDLAYSEVIAGLSPGERVLLLPSTSLYEQQERLQQFISQRFGGTPFQQQAQPVRIR